MSLFPVHAREAETAGGKVENHKLFPFNRQSVTVSTIVTNSVADFASDVPTVSQLQLDAPAAVSIYFDILRCKKHRQSGKHRQASMTLPKRERMHMRVASKAKTTKPRGKQPRWFIRSPSTKESKQPKAAFNWSMNVFIKRYADTTPDDGGGSCGLYKRAMGRQLQHTSVGQHSIRSCGNGGLNQCECGINRTMQSSHFWRYLLAIEIIGSRAFAQLDQPDGDLCDEVG
ncbi:hypothetical protein CAPTEDRAFT_188228 [Capitella teleta]|uniref:Uncharacterized protein n=1 Tax=Capitella teleta TaxID=283909 RepID=R7TEN7_CAPTE|nr:hypothetical protein CAPTEDRAFT_188228 [Capitella teleta]|eukprot:ELT92218.1 hypothetical protein CAPTEDRAFT_188228 [Capitella teleta]